jgi:hypothetical protein
MGTPGTASGAARLLRPKRERYSMPRMFPIPFRAGASAAAAFSLAALLATVALLPARALATEQTGKLRGVVTDPSEQPLEGVLVRVASPSMQGLRTSKTDARGQYWLPGLPPGEYEIQAEYAGFKTHAGKGLRISIGTTLTINIQLRPAEVTESVDVVDERPVIDTSTSTASTVITREHLEMLPVGRSYQSAMRLAPGVTGGANPNALGGSAYENKYLLDGANTTDPVTGTFSFNFNMDAIEEVEVITGAFRAEHGGSLGLINNIRTKSGSNRLEGGLKAYYSNANWSPKRDATFAPDARQIEGSEFDRDSQAFDLNVFLGGPLLRDKIWVFGSFKYIRNVSVAQGARSPRVFDGFNAFGKVTASLFPRNHFVLSVSHNLANISNTIQSVLTDPDAQSAQYQDSLVVNGEWNWYVTDRITWKLQYTHLDSNVDVTPQPCTWRDDERFKACQPGQDEGYIDWVTPAHVGAGGARSTRNGSSYSLNDRRRDSLFATLTGYAVTPIGSHEIKGGAELSWLGADNLAGRPGNIRYYDVLEDPSDPTSTIPYYWVEYQGQLFQRHKGSAIFAFVQDSWEPVAGLTLDIGLKYDRATLRNDEGERIVGFDFLSPVGGVAWDPTGKQILKIFAGGGIVIDESRLAVSNFIDRNGLGYKLYLGEYFDREGNHSFDQYTYFRAQSNYEKYAQLTSPRVYNLVAGFDVQVGGKTSVTVMGNMKLFRHLWEDDEVNFVWNDAGSSTIGVINGLQDDFFRLRTPDEARRNYFSLVVQVRREMWKNLLLDVSYTASSSRGLTDTYITEALDNPTQRPYEYGWLDIDRPHVLKASAAYRLPTRTILGAGFNLTSGSRFDRRFSTSKGFANYVNFTAERGTFDSVKPWWFLDLKITQEIPTPHGKFQIIAELHNVTNNRQATGIATGVLNERGEYFASGRQPPMDLEIGIGYEW